MNPLTPLGVFGLTGSSPFHLDPADLMPLRDALAIDIRNDVAKYLRSGTIILPIMEYTTDVLGDAFGVSGGSAVLSDGKFYWRRDAAEYVALYGIAIDAVAIEHMHARSWVAPELSPDTIADVDNHLFRTLRRGT
jgi:hypothetical protein